MNDDPEIPGARLERLAALAHQTIEQARLRVRRAEARLDAAQAATAQRQTESRSRMARVQSLHDRTPK